MMAKIHITLILLLSIKLHCLCMRVGVIFLLLLQRYLVSTVKIGTVNNIRTQWSQNNEHSWYIRDDVFYWLPGIGLFFIFILRLRLKVLEKPGYIYYRFTIRKIKWRKTKTKTTNKKNINWSARVRAREEKNGEKISPSLSLPGNHRLIIMIILVIIPVFFL